MKKETELLTGLSDEAIDIVNAFGLKNKAVTHVNFDLCSGRIAILKVWEEVNIGLINIPELKIIMNKYKLVKIGDNEKE